MDYLGVVPGHSGLGQAKGLPLVRRSTSSRTAFDETPSAARKASAEFGIERADFEPLAMQAVDRPARDEDRPQPRHHGLQPLEKAEDVGYFEARGIKPRIEVVGRAVEVIIDFTDIPDYYGKIFAADWNVGCRSTRTRSFETDQEHGLRLDVATADRSIRRTGRSGAWMKIDGAKRRQIREALVEAFPLPKDLRMVTDEVLNVPLQNITGINNDMVTMTFELLEWAQARGRLTELVIGAAAANPGAGPLKALADQFAFVAAAPGEVERIVLKDVPFENIGQWLDRLSLQRRAVCRIEAQPPPDFSGYGTGFLVADDVVMTNYHVIAPFIAGASSQVVLRFDYETDRDGVATSPGRACKLAATWLLIHSPVEELDFALVRLAEPAARDAVPAGQRGTLRPTRKLPGAGGPLIILQHPRGAAAEASDRDGCRSGRCPEPGHLHREHPGRLVWIALFQYRTGLGRPASLRRQAKSRREAGGRARFLGRPEAGVGRARTGRIDRLMWRGENCQ